MLCDFAITDKVHKKLSINLNTFDSLTIIQLLFCILWSLQDEKWILKDNESQGQSQNKYACNSELQTVNVLVIIADDKYIFMIKI